MSLVRKYTTVFLRGPGKTDFYIGSTSQSLGQRLSEPKAETKRGNSKLYKRMR